MRNKLFVAQMLAATAMIEAGGPVRVKEYRSSSVLDELERKAAERRERNRLRLEREQAALAAIRAQTPDHVWARIERDEKRRADRKAAKKELKKAKKSTPARPC
jgi:hypothetical protein